MRNTVAFPRQNRHVATLLVAATTLLLLIGSVMVYSTTSPLALGSWLPPHFTRHVIGVGMGVAIAGIAALLPLSFWKLSAFPLWLIGVVALLATLFIGLKIQGAQRWLEIPLIGSCQPGELAKFATVLAVGALLAHQDGKKTDARHRVGWAIALVGLPTSLLIAQPDLGNAILLLAISGTLFFIAGFPWRWMILPGAAAISLFTLFILFRPYAHRRWIGFLDPWTTAHNQGFQLVQSYVAFGRGGSTGVGLGFGKQKLHYLPEAHTDFVLSVIAEELGLIGVIVVLGAFALLLIAGIRIAVRSRYRIGAYFSFGMTMFIVLPALVNAAVVMGVLPTKGLSLPFLSYGRSSLLVSCAAIGIIIGVGLRSTRGGNKGFLRGRAP